MAPKSSRPNRRPRRLRSRRRNKTLRISSECSTAFGKVTSMTQRAPSIGFSVQLPLMTRSENGFRTTTSRRRQYTETGPALRNCARSWRSSPGTWRPEPNSPTTTGISTSRMTLLASFWMACPPRALLAEPNSCDRRPAPIPTLASMTARSKS